MRAPGFDRADLPRPWRQGFKAENLPDWPKRPAMAGCDAMPFHRREVLTNGIAFVFRKAISRIFGVEPEHERGARVFGKNRRRGNCQAPGIASHDGLLRYRHVLDASRIDQQMLRYKRQRPATARRIASMPAQ